MDDVASRPDRPVLLRTGAGYRPPPGRDRGQDAKVQVRIPPYTRAALARYCTVHGISQAQGHREAIDLLLTGYPCVPPELHAWLTHTAARSGLDSPQAALDAILVHLSRRFAHGWEIPTYDPSGARPPAAS